MLSPQHVLSVMVMDVLKFLWKGVRVSIKKFHLINWATMKYLKLHGGLGIRDRTLVNKAVGANITWRLITQEWD